GGPLPCGRGPRLGALAVDVRPFVLKPDETVRDVLERVRQSPVGFGVVVGDGGELLGTVDDGAIRRAALVHSDLDGPVTRVASSRPLVAEKSDGDARVLDLLRSYRVRAIPVVDEGRLVAVRTSDEFEEPVAPTP